VARERRRLTAQVAGVGGARQCGLAGRARVRSRNAPWRGMGGGKARDGGERSGDYGYSSFHPTRTRADGLGSLAPGRGHLAVTKLELMKGAI
jgi:hypothetical protein